MKSMFKSSVVRILTVILGSMVVTSAHAVEMICELKLDRKAEEVSLHFETYNTDADRFPIWLDLFGIEPGASASTEDLVLQLPDRAVTWSGGDLEMGGVMQLDVKSDKKVPGLKKLKISKAKKKDAFPTIFVSGSGGLNPNVADAGWHEVKIKNLFGVLVSVDGADFVPGFLKELKVKLDKHNLFGATVVKDFKLKWEGFDLLIPDVKKGSASSVVIFAPATTVIAIAETEYEEELKDKPAALMGHTEAELNHSVGGVDISPLFDGFNDVLKERKGPCLVTPALGGPDDPCDILDAILAEFLADLGFLGADIPLAVDILVDLLSGSSAEEIFVILDGFFPPAVDVTMLADTLSGLFPFGIADCRP